MFIALFCLEFHCESKRKLEKASTGKRRQLRAEFVWGDRNQRRRCCTRVLGGRGRARGLPRCCCCFGHDNCQLVCVPPSILNRLLCMATLVSCRFIIFIRICFIIYSLPSLPWSQRRSNERESGRESGRELKTPKTIWEREKVTRTIKMLFYGPSRWPK